MFKSAHLRTLCGIFLSFLLCQSSAMGFSGYGHPEDEDDRQFRSQDDDRYFRPSQGGFRERSPYPKHIALLLPLSGKHAEAAKAIREGFLASYYKHAQISPAQSTVRVYDTTKGNIRQLYFKAIDEGADFVIGPLSKEDVYQLSQLPKNQMSAPILALNYHPQSRPSASLIQFSLAPEDEAAQLADKAWQSGYKTASIIVPNSDWGKRTAAAFSQQWQQHGGRILQLVYADAARDQSSAVRRLLGVDLQQRSKKDLAKNKNEKPQKPEVDVIVMAAPPEQARQWKPLFDFYYAEDIPVYATSSIYSGTPNPKLDRDMNGVIFCDMPWLIDTHRGQEMRELLSQTQQENSTQYNRLFAMGVDAYQLSRSLDSGVFRVYEGVTGNLKIDQNNYVKRQLVCAQIKDGVPQPLR